MTILAPSSRGVSLVLLLILVLNVARAGESTPPAKHVLRPVSNRQLLDLVRVFCSQANLSITEVGDYPVKYLFAGSPPSADLDRDRTLAVNALKTVEEMTGSQEYILHQHGTPEQAVVLYVIDDGRFDALVDFLVSRNAIQAQSAEMAKKCHGFNGILGCFEMRSGFNQIPDYWSVYASTCSSIDLYFAASEHPRISPSWIREGFAAEMQIELCHNEVHCASIAYELHPDAAVISYAKDVAQMINHGDQMVLDANSALHKTIAAIAGAHYRQLWSFFAYIQGHCGTTRGMRNKMSRIMAEISDGTDGADAIKTVLGLKDPALTRGWHEWASAQ